MKLRLGLFIAAIAAVLVLIAWTAHNSWQRTSDLREKLTAGQLQSFQIADHFQHAVLQLNNTLLRYGVSRLASDWDQFAASSKDLDNWIDDQASTLTSDREKQILDQINAAYDLYMKEARKIGELVRANSGPTRLDDFAQFEAESRNLLNLGFQLATSHREALDSFVQSSQKSLLYLRSLLLISLLLLLAAGGGLAFVVYRELIAPLQIKLVESQALVERQEKLAALGMLAAGVAHEIRNPLTAIKAWLFIQQKNLKPGSPEQEDSQVISEEVNRLDKLVKDVLLFGRPSEPNLATVDIVESLNSVQQLMAPQLAKANLQLAVENSFHANVRIDPQQIKQVLINLVQNAADAMEGRSGQVTLRARPATKPLLKDNADAVVLEVSDKGRGIPPDVEKRLFDPFFTTKESGTGLGLSVAARIVEKHGGLLQYQTQVNHGTTFGIVLPRA
jgi:signal transduction histidine kinase